MSENYLITGYWGTPHVTAENDRGIQGGIVGAGRSVLPVGNQFRTEYIGNNTIRMFDGKLMDNGAAAGVAAGEYIDFVIANAGQGMKRNDLIVFQYRRNTSTLVETGEFIVLQGTETSGTATDPKLTQEDLLSGNAVLDQMPMWRIPVNGVDVGTPVQLFNVSTATCDLAHKDHVHGNLTKDGQIGTVPGRFVMTGTGGRLIVTTPETARDALPLHPVAVSGDYNDLKNRPETIKVEVDNVVTPEGTKPVSGAAVAEYVAAQLAGIINLDEVKF